MLRISFKTELIELKKIAMYFSMSTESHGKFGRRIKSVFYTAQHLMFGTFLMDHPVVPSDYYLFSNLKKLLRWQRFSSSDKVIATVDGYLEHLHVSLYAASIKKLSEQYTKCISLNDDLPEKLPKFL